MKKSCLAIFLGLKRKHGSTHRQILPSYFFFLSSGQNKHNAFKEMGLMYYFLLLLFLRKSYKKVSKPIASAVNVRQQKFVFCP